MGAALKLTPLPSSLGGLFKRGQYPKVTVLADLENLDAEVFGQQCPSSNPSVALLEATHGENRLLAASPAHAGALGTSA